MNKFLFKSSETSDFQKLFQLTEVIQKNVLYVTHRVDSIYKLLKSMEIDGNLQKQIPDYPLEDMAQDGNSSDT